MTDSTEDYKKEEQLIEAIKLICSNPENQKIVLKYCKNYDDPIEAIYEVGFMLKSEKMSLKDSIGFLKEKKLGKTHKNFEEISKKMIETDNFMDNSFDVREGSEICGNPKCKSQRTISHAKHLNDEGACVFIFCVDCKNRFIRRS